MSAGEKLARLDALFRDARALVEAGVRLRRPDLHGNALRDEVQRMFTHVDA